MNPMYGKVEGAVLKGDPQEIGDRLSEIYGDNSNKLLAADIVDDARSPLSPLHKEFEWDDTVAAVQYRLEQAGNIIRAITIVQADGPDSVRAFINVIKGDRYYAPITYVVTQPDLREQMLDNALKEFEAFRRKYKNLQEFAAVFKLAAKISA